MNQHATYFDCLLTVGAEGLVVEYQGRPLPGVQVPAGAVGGLVGVTAWSPGAATWIFSPYLDAALRRRPELDSPQRLGWRNASRPGGWTAPRGILPGVGGAFVEDETESFRVRVPPEFISVAARYRVNVARLLRAFVADACGIEPRPGVPRADSYSKTNSAAHAAAGAYLIAAFGQPKHEASQFVLPAEDDECELVTIAEPVALT